MMENLKNATVSPHCGVTVHERNRYGARRNVESSPAAASMILCFLHTLVFGTANGHASSKFKVAIQSEMGVILMTMTTMAEKPRRKGRFEICYYLLE